MLSRRQFLGSAAGLSAVALGGRVPLFVQAADEAAGAKRTDRVLVVVELNGGNDGLNTVIPFENDAYHKARPTLHIEKDKVVKLNDQIGLHPNMGAAAELFKDGKLTIVQGVLVIPGAEPLCIFARWEIWQTASTAARAPTTGWLGRVLDLNFKEDDSEWLGALAITDSLPQALLAEKVNAPVVKVIESFGTAVADTPDADPARARLLRKLSTGPTVKGEPIPLKPCGGRQRDGVQLRRETPPGGGEIQTRGRIPGWTRRTTQASRPGHHFEPAGAGSVGFPGRLRHAQQTGTRPRSVTRRTVRSTGGVSKRHGETGHR